MCELREVVRKLAASTMGNNGVLPDRTLVTSVSPTLVVTFVAPAPASCEAAVHGDAAPMELDDEDDAEEAACFRGGKDRRTRPSAPETRTTRCQMCSGKHPRKPPRGRGCS